ncbi:MULTISPECIES: CRISPR-associated endonuclease Cas2 [Brevibacillus]|uniref:CRISPR-associated endoribonuclease Cas2 n=1 Tax=Brevibacillus invocatus TaxID=173959 RepID=A0A3M8C3B3_9BACL|nr:MULTISPECIES: CRISPR-associated endonuclease Cas2 [Brevibacillus]MCM3080625.1 CRISPR-associated endonuclease Cas2 [Brevibacillus invocatus]MCM3430758.1 CRISPR-associated endonuclease Cas2 [Brevibacillus invocatus]MDH4618966.1 CRISPR-associated endonuclease Cas2 [Brevibacillus sp. AY1]RNB69933.1 CRISPR-associated endonuclease Cas2 [Brevibacillus invocatus]
MPKRQVYLICYDIADAKRWRKCHKLVKGYGERVQYSVFKCHLTDKQLAEMRWKLVKLLEEEDRLLIAPILPEALKDVFVFNMNEKWEVEKERFLLF